MKPQLTNRSAEILLLTVIAVRATSYMFSKQILTDLEPLNLLGIRFLLAFAVMSLLFIVKLRRVTPRELGSGILLGTALFAVMAFELYGLRTTSSSVCSFLENTAIVFVPLFEAALLRRLPSLRSILIALTAMAGVSLLTLRGSLGRFSTGEFLCMMAAVLYAVTIILTDRVSRQGDPLRIGIVQVGTVGILGILVSFFTETPHLPTEPGTWSMLLVLALLCTAFGFTMQPVAQSRTSAEKAGLFTAIAPVISAVCGFLFLHENTGPAGILGSLLILCAIGVSVIPSKSSRQKRQKRDCPAVSLRKADSSEPACRF